MIIVNISYNDGYRGFIDVEIVDIECRVVLLLIFVVILKVNFLNEILNCFIFC